MLHQQKFFNFIKDLNENKIRYYFLRGFIKLPRFPDTDIDLVCHLDDWDLFNKIAQKHLIAEGFQNFGYAEYCEMQYHPYFTPGPVDHSIPNGKRIEVLYDVPYHIPSKECEVLLLVLRNILDFQGTWKAKHVNRINQIKDDCDKEELIKCTKMVLPHSKQVVQYIYDSQYHKIFNLVMEN